MSNKLQVPTLIGILFFVLLSFAVPAQSGGWFEKRVAPANVGEQAPEFSLPDIEGEEVELSRFRGKFVLLGFWASWCPPCREEMPSLEKFHRKFTGDKLALLTVNVGEPPSEVRAFVSSNSLTFPVLLDPSGKVQKLYGAYQFPVFFLIDPQGRIVTRYLGLRNWTSPEVRRELNERMRN